MKTLADGATYITSLGHKVSFENDNIVVFGRKQEIDSDLVPYLYDHGLLIFKENDKFVIDYQDNRTGKDLIIKLSSLRTTCNKAIKILHKMTLSCRKCILPSKRPCDFCHDTGINSEPVLCSCGKMLSETDYGRK